MFNSLVPSFHGKTAIFASTLFLLAALNASAEVIQLTSGKIVEGAVVLRNEEFIKVDTGLGIPVTYFLDEIDTIDGKPLAPPEEDAGAAAAVEPLATIETPDEEELTTEIMPEKDALPPGRPAPRKEPAPPPAVQQQRLPSPSENLSPGKRAEDFLLYRVQKQLGGPAAEPRPPKAGRTEGIKNALFRKADQYVRRQIQNFNEHKARFQQKLPLIRKKLEQIPLKVRRDILVLASSCLVIIYIFVCFPFMKIARRLNMKHAWIAWIPVLQVFLFIKMANKPLWWFFLFFVPVIGFFMPIVLWIHITQLLQKSFWLGILMIVPGLNIFILWYLAMSRVK